MSTINMSTALRTSRSTAIVTLAGATAFLNIYSGSIPANPDTVASGTLLVQLPCSAVLGTVTSGVLTFNAITTTAAIATGTAGYARLVTSSGATTGIIDLDVGTTGTSVVLNTTSIATGGPVVVNSAVITEA